ncbi:MULTISPECIES: stressosome-associated protein Prli42 [Metabacillus]|nr:MULTISPECIES: stressosome-associated protein Prli42 [Metabacillus]MDX8291062.1 stressosome-associated protein Prli42 [Metabacillus indicus]
MSKRFQKAIIYLMLFVMLATTLLAGMSMWF